MKTKRFVYYQDGDMFIGWPEDFPDYRTQGKTLDELNENLKDLYKDVEALADVYTGRDEERYAQVKRILEKATELFKSPERAQHWFQTPKIALGGKSPSEYAQTEDGASEVEDLLGRLEWGVYS